MATFTEVVLLGMRSDLRVAWNGSAPGNAVGYR